MTDVVRLPMWMLPAVEIVVRRKVWRASRDPIEQIRSSANREALRMGLVKPEAGEPVLPSKSRKAHELKKMPH